MVFLTAILLSMPENAPRNTSPFPWCPRCLSLLGHPGEPRSGERVPAGLRWDARDSIAAQTGCSAASSLLPFASSAGKSPDDQRGHGCGCSKGGLLLPKRKC